METSVIQNSAAPLASTGEKGRSDEKRAQNDSREAQRASRGCVSPWRFFRLLFPREAGIIKERGRCIDGAHCQKQPGRLVFAVKSQVLRNSRLPAMKRSREIKLSQGNLGLSLDARYCSSPPRFFSFPFVSVLFPFWIIGFAVIHYYEHCFLFAVSFLLQKTMRYCE